MKVFGIADLHLPGSRGKGMDIFGEHWNDHQDRIASNWQKSVSDDDVVLVPGDISWAMNLEEASDDLAYLGQLPGRIIIIKGNHDYWWTAIGKVRRSLPPNVTALQNDCWVDSFSGLVVCGTRGWALPGSPGTGEDDERIYRRELIRLEMSLQCARRYATSRSRIIAMIHYPPAYDYAPATGFTDLLEQYGAEFCLYGHLHDRDRSCGLEGTRGDVTYMLVASDAINFNPRLVLEIV